MEFNDSLKLNEEGFNSSIKWNGNSNKMQLTTPPLGQNKKTVTKTLKVHKREKFFGSDFEFFTILVLIKLKY